MVALPFTETAALRVFSNADGAYGANVNMMIENGRWDDEDELGAVVEVVRDREDGPAGQHLGEARDIVLRVAAAHAERMQLQDLACQVLVEANVALAFCLRAPHGGGKKMDPDSDEYKLVRELLAARVSAGLTKEQVAGPLVTQFLGGIDRGPNHYAYADIFELLSGRTDTREND